MAKTFDDNDNKTFCFSNLLLMAFSYLKATPGYTVFIAVWSYADILWSVNDWVLLLMNWTSGHLCCCGACSRHKVLKSWLLPKIPVNKTRLMVLRTNGKHNWCPIFGVVCVFCLKHTVLFFLLCLEHSSERATWAGCFLTGMSAGLEDEMIWRAFYLSHPFFSLFFLYSLHLYSKPFFTSHSHSGVKSPISLFGPPVCSSLDWRRKAL